MSSSNGNGKGRRVLLAGDARAIDEVRKLLLEGDSCSVEVQSDGARAASMALETSFDAVLVCCRQQHQEFLRLLGTLFSNSGVTEVTPSPEESVPVAGA